MPKQYLHLFQTSQSETNYSHSSQYEEPYLAAVDPIRRAYYNKANDSVIVDPENNVQYNLKYHWTGEDAPVSNNWYDRVSNKAWNTSRCTYDSTNKWYDMSANNTYCYMANNGQLQLGAQFKIFIRTMYKYKSGMDYGNYIGDLASLRTGSINTSLGHISSNGTGIHINCKSADNNDTNPAYGPSTSQENFSSWTDFRYLEYEIGYEKLSSTQARCYSIYNNQICNGTIHTPLNWNVIGTTVGSSAAGYFTLGMGFITSVGTSPKGTGPSSKAPIKMMEIKIYVSDT